MKLLTSSGLLFAATQATATTDGNYGAYTMIDWTVNFNEAYLLPAVLKYSPTAIQTIGLSPAVTSLLVTSDGGKMMAGYGKFDGFTTFGWVIKLFGTDGTVTGCDVGAKPTGYQTFLSYPNNDTTSSTCSTGVQWSYLQEYALVANLALSSLYLTLAEDWSAPLQTGTSLSAMYFVGGGIEARGSYGLGTWNALLIPMTLDGVIATVATDVPLGYPENTHPNGSATSTLYMGLSYGTNGCMTASDAYMFATNATTETVLVGGNTAMQRTCLDWAVDGYLIDGVPFIYQFWVTGGPTFALATNQNALYHIPIDAISDDYSPTLAGTAAANMGGVTQIQTQYTSGATTKNFTFLLSGFEEYCDSNIFGIKHTTMVAASVLGQPIAHETFGVIRAYWPFLSSSTASNYTASIWDQAALVGTLRGKGVYTSVAITNTGNNDITFGVPNAAGIFSNTTWCTVATGMCAVKAPTGGIAQFKGLTQGTAEDKYVSVVCTGVQPVYGATRWQGQSSAAGGFILTCMTGIASCVDHLQHNATVAPVGHHPLTATERLACVQDVRYLTWRMMTLRIAYDGAQTWYRTDSHWDQASVKVGSTWGPGIKISTHIHTDKDNDSGSTTTTLGKTYVFAFGDGTGVSLNHLSYDVVIPTTNAKVGDGTNIVIAAPATFKNVDPYLYEHNYCSETNIALTGIADTSALSTTVAAYSDGYMVTSVMTNNTLFAGALLGWRGTCLVYHSSQYVQDATNGSVCHVVARSTVDGAGMQDFGEQWVLHIPAASWQPGQQSGPVQPKNFSIASETKYGVNVSPASATKYMMTDQFYSTAKWYQPAPATTYTDVARYGKEDWVAAYCMQGTGTTSYFNAPDSAVQLSGGAALVAGAALIATTILAL